MNCWIFLLNAGHLHGTFFTETELLFALRRLRSATSDPERELIGAVPQRAEEWARRVIQSERTYQMYQLLAFYRLSRLLRNSPSLDTYMTMLADFVAPRGDESIALTRTRQLFRSLRRLAFLSLDSALTPTLVEVRISQLASSPESLERLVSPSQGSLLFGDEMRSLEEFLHRDIYNGRRVLLEIERSRGTVSARMARDLRKTGLRHVVESFAKTPTMAILSRNDRDAALSPVVRVEIRNPFWAMVDQEQSPAPRRRLVEQSFRRWSAWHNSDARVVMTNDATNSQLVYQVHVRTGSSNNFAAGIAGGILLTRRIMRRFPENLRSLVMGVGLEDLLYSGLRHFFALRARWEFDDDLEQVLGSRVIFGNRHEVQDGMRRATERNGVTRARRHELASTAEVLTTMRARHVVAAASNIRAFAADQRTTLAELDGVVLGIDELRRDLVLCLVEAKNQASRPEAAAKDQLRQTLAVLNPRPGIRAGALNSCSNQRRARAWTYLRSSYQGGPRG
jgi:hypothetical protein